VARLRADPSFPSEAARVRAFIAAGAGCRATYFHHAQKLRPIADVPKLALTHATPFLSLFSDIHICTYISFHFSPRGQGVDDENETSWRRGCPTERPGECEPSGALRLPRHHVRGLNNNDPGTLPAGRSRRSALQGSNGREACGSSAS
jgi:hypothetical protein